MAHEQSGGDYEYDLAHDEVPPQREVAAPPPPPVPATQTADVPEHDYSYDLAHDIPPARRG